MKTIKAILFPPTPIFLIFTPISTALLVLSLMFLKSNSIIAIFSYLIAFYTLTIWCFKLPNIIRYFTKLKNKNKYLKIWQKDANLRVNISLCGTMVQNTAYALLHLGIGIWHHSFWFCSLSGYYLSLAVIRFFLFRHTRKHKPREKISAELRKYRACGVALLIMNLMLSLMIFFMTTRANCTTRLPVNQQWR